MRDPEAERLVLAGLIQYGDEVYYDISTHIKDTYFFALENKIIYNTISKLVLDKNVKKLDLNTILAEISNTDKELVETYEINEYLGALSNHSILKENVVNFAVKVQKLALARNFAQRLLESVDKLGQITGDEKITEIISIAEEPINAFTNTSLGQEAEIVSLSSIYNDYLLDRVNNPTSHLGLPT
ncbi:MAG: hypothetical protein EBR67_10600, partial [Proteobacteria bacterium]|nr:hypothetical protein [Pseudomonadota bacterium]